MTSLALASLTETYTDSEGEENVSKESIIIDSPDLMKQPEIPKPKGPTTLVSYHAQDDTIASDDEHHGEITTSTDTSTTTEQTTSGSANTSTNPIFMDVDLPPEPTGSCSSDLTEKIVEMTRRMQEKGYDMNLIIQQRKSFRNPSIYEKLIDYCNINEFGTNYEPQIYDPLKWDKTSYYDELAKLQKADMEQREKERRERTKIEFLTGTAKKVTNGTAATAEEDTKKRKSKWDQVVYPQAAGPRLQTSVTTLTTAATGTKGIVISAFGSLPKKAKS